MGCYPAALLGQVLEKSCAGRPAQIKEIISRIDAQKSIDEILRIYAKPRAKAKRHQLSYISASRFDRLERLACPSLTVGGELTTDH